MQHVSHQHASQLFTDTENGKLLIQASCQFECLNTVKARTLWRMCAVLLCIYTDVNYRERNVLLLLTATYCLKHAALIHKGFYL